MAFKTRRPRYCNVVLGDEGTTGINFEAQAKSVSLKADRDSGIDLGLTPSAKYPYADEPTWTLSIGYWEGVDTDMSKVLGSYLFAHDGEILPFTYRPDANNLSVGFKGNVMVLTGGFGSEQGSTSEQSVDLPVQGQPIMLDGTYLGGGTVGGGTWTATTAYKLGQTITVGGKILYVTTAGTSASTSPTAPAAVGGTVVDGSVTWTRLT